MDLELDDEHLELREHARAFLDDACPPSLVRAVHEGRDRADGLWSAMVDLGWPGISAPAASGGLGQGFITEAVLAAELGRVVAPSPWMATVTQFDPVLVEADASELATQVSRGAVTGALAMEEAGGCRPEHVATTARRDADGWVLHGVKTPVPDGASADQLAVVARLDGTSGDAGLGAFLVPRTDATVEPLDVIDPTMPLARVRLDGVRVRAGAVLLDPRDPTSGPALERVRRHATVLLALHGVATCREIFATTLAYAKVRHQFGRPIGANQAVKHRLADLFLAVERADALCWYAALTVAEDDSRAPVATAMAKAAAGDCQRLATRDGLQLHGAIGFIREHDLHLWLTRATTCSFLFGNAERHRIDLASLLDLAS